MIVLITGCCGFIGSHVSIRLLELKYDVVGVDVMNDYYDVKIKENNKKILMEYNNFKFYKEDLVNSDIVDRIKPDKIIHLA